jgi:hypothetical protein
MPVGAAMPKMHLLYYTKTFRLRNSPHHQGMLMSDAGDRSDSLEVRNQRSDM